MTEGNVFEANVPLLRGEASLSGRSFDVDEVIFQMISESGYATVPGVAAVAGVTERTARRHLSLLADEDRVKPLGRTRDRRYVLPTERMIGD